MRRSDYSHEFEQDVHVLTDLNDGGASLTDDIENVIRDLHILGLDMTMPVIRRDPLGYYERVLVANGEFAKFLPLDTKDRAAAIRTLHRIYALAAHTKEAKPCQRRT